MIICGQGRSANVLSHPMGTLPAEDEPDKVHTVTRCPFCCLCSAMVLFVYFFGVFVLFVGDFCCHSLGILVLFVGDFAV